MGGRGSWSATRKGGGAVSTSGGRTGQKVPKPMDVSQFNGWSLQQVEDRIRGLGHEELFVIDRNGAVVAAYKGNSNSVAFKRDELLKEGVTVTHGHPKGGEGYGATFSPQDVLNMAASNWSEHRAAASGKNELNYIIRRNSSNSDAKSRALYKRMTADAPKLQSEMNRLASASGMSLSPVARRQIYTGVLDRYYSSTLPQYGFDYIVRKKQYNYGR